MSHLDMVLRHNSRMGIVLWWYYLAKKLGYHRLVARGKYYITFFGIEDSARHKPPSVFAGQLTHRTSRQIIGQIIGIALRAVNDAGPVERDDLWRQQIRQRSRNLSVGHGEGCLRFRRTRRALVGARPCKLLSREHLLARSFKGDRAIGRK